MKLSILFAGLVSIGIASAQQAGEQTRKHGLEACLRKTRAPFKTPGSPEYGDLAEPFNLRLHYKPIAIVVPETTEHVQEAVKCAALHRFKVQARSGGHSYASFSTGGQNGSMVIDLQNFQSITATGNPSIYEVGTGLRLGNLANGIWKQGKHALPHGTCTGVGVGGHFTHGGYGHTSRNWGASLDRLVGAEVVLANGTLVKTSAKENSDIFWAMRGAADSIGIATKFVVSTERAPEFLTYFSFKWNDVFNGTKEDFTNKFLHIQDFSRNETVVDEKISFGIYLDGTVYNVGGTFFGTAAEFEYQVQPEFLRTLSTPSSITVKEYNWIDYLFLMSDKTSGTIEEPITGYDQHDDFFAKSITVPESRGVSADSLNSMWDYIKDTPAPTPYFIIINLYGGPGSSINAKHKKALDYSAYKHRDSLFVFQIYGRANATEEGSTGAASVPFIQGLHEAITSADKETEFGAYLNYVDPSLSPEEAHRLYYGDQVYSRLAQIKAQVDPQGVFWNPQAIGTGVL